MSSLQMGWLQKVKKVDKVLLNLKKKTRPANFTHWNLYFMQEKSLKYSLIVMDQNM